MSAAIYEFPAVTKRRVRLWVDVDEITFARLLEVSDMSHADPQVVAASLLHDVLQDDADAHAAEQAAELRSAH